MKLLTVALDYDGTIAKDGLLDGQVKEAIARLRAQNIVVLIVTGRILEELRTFAGDLHFVDAVVAENGAVLEFTGSGYSKAIGSVPPVVFLDALSLEGIAFKVGQCVVEASAADGPSLLAIIQRLELPLVLLFNRGRVMVLPQSVSKATGLAEALKILRLSPHNALAIGDAENDHELLQFCEVGVAVAWGSKSLKASADEVIEGTEPSSVAAFLNKLADSPELPRLRNPRRKLLLGYTDSGEPLNLMVRGRTVLVSGDTKSGKSWVTGLLCEQLILYGYSLLVIDPEGDYISLEALPGVTVLGGLDPLPRSRDLIRTLRHADASIVIDLSHTPQKEKIEYVRTLLIGVATLRRRTGLPHRVVIDEAHYFLHGQDATTLFDLHLGAYTLVTYRTSQLHPDLVKSSEAIVVTRESSPEEVALLRRLCNSCSGADENVNWDEMLERLVPGEAVALPLTEEAGGCMQHVRLAPRLTPHVRHVAKYIDIPVAEQKQFVFWHDDMPTGQKARTLREFVSVLERLQASYFSGHIHRQDFSRWIGEVFGDYPLAKTVRQYEQDYISGRSSEIVPDLIQAIRSRYEFADPLSAPGQ